jgi:recombination protein RecR
MSASRALTGLVQALGCLPGVGAKSASRMAHQLLGHDRQGALRLAQALTHAATVVRHCSRCNTLCEDEVCETCANPQRDVARLCVVETPADQEAMERTRAFNGYYFVLMGRLSPLDGVGPNDIGLQALFDRVFDGRVAASAPATGASTAPVMQEHSPQIANRPVVQELILATNFTAEGEATAHVIAQALKGSGVKVSRLAKGVPAGSELEYVDLSTLAHALVDRR